MNLLLFKLLLVFALPACSRLWRHGPVNDAYAPEVKSNETGQSMPANIEQRISAEASKISNKTEESDAQVCRDRIEGCDQFKDMCKVYLQKLLHCCKKTCGGCGKDTPTTTPSSNTINSSKNKLLGLPDTSNSMQGNHKNENSFYEGDTAEGDKLNDDEEGGTGYNQIDDGNDGDRDVYEGLDGVDQESSTFSTHVDQKTTTSAGSQIGFRQGGLDDADQDSDHTIAQPTYRESADEEGEDVGSSDNKDSWTSHDGNGGSGSDDAETEENSLRNIDGGTNNRSKDGHTHDHSGDNTLQETLNSQSLFTGDSQPENIPPCVIPPGYKLVKIEGWTDEQALNGDGHSLGAEDDGEDGEVQHKDVLGAENGHKSESINSNDFGDGDEAASMDKDPDGIHSDGGMDGDAESESENTSPSNLSTPYEFLFLNTTTLAPPPNCTCKEAILKLRRNYTPNASGSDKLSTDKDEKVGSKLEDGL